MSATRDVTPADPRAARAPLRGSLAEWREFGARRYRPFHVLAVAQGVIGPLSGPAIVLPLVLALGAPPAVASALAVLPVLGTTLQRGVPAALDRTNGNLRGLVILASALSEWRGLLLAGVVALAAGGLLPHPLAIVLIGLVMGVMGALAAIGYGMLQAWYQIILPDAERRLVGPRLAGITLGIGSVILLPIAFLIDGWVHAIGLFAYVIPLGLAGLVGSSAAFVEGRLPSPGRVHVPRGPLAGGERSDRLDRLARVIALANLAAGLSPFLSVYAIGVLGTGPGFAVAISATSSAALVAASVALSSHLRAGSSSRLLRASMFVRAAALLGAVTAFPGNPGAPVILLAVAVVLAAGDTAGLLSANERLFRLASGPSVLAFQSRFVVRNVSAYSGGLLAGSAIILAGGYPPFAVLFGAAAVTRLVAARLTEVSRIAAEPSGA